MKKVISLMLSFIMLLSITVGLDLSAYAATSKDWDYTLLDNGTVEIDYYLGNEVNVTIPNEIDGNKVTSIEGAFNTNRDLISVKIPNSVTNIGNGTFAGCDALNSVEMSSSVASIDDAAFLDCKRLTSIILPNSVVRIGENAFYGCKSLTSITIPNSVKEIGSCAFMNCTGLANITIQNSVARVGYSAFAGTAYFNNENNWSDGVLYLGSYLIDSRQDVLSDTYLIKYGTTVIADSAFFNICNNLTNIIIPDSVKIIGDSAFAICGDLINITIPSSVIYIGYAPFEHCSNLENITVDSNNKNYKSVNGVLYDKNQTKLISYPGNKGVTSFNIPNTVTKIEDFAFSSSNLKSIVIPNSVTVIGYCAFSSSDYLKNITISDNITNIGGDAFYQTDYYHTKDNWENGVLYLGKYLIDSDDEVVPSEYTIKNGTVLIADKSFEGCKSLENIIIPDSLTTIGDYVFNGYVRSATVPKSVKYIAPNAFPSLHVLYCYYGSPAYKYAEENHIKCKFISDEGIEKINTFEMKITTLSSDKDKSYFIFTPIESGKYDVYCDSGYICIFDSNMNQLEKIENEEEDFFGSYYSLEKGKKYYLVVSNDYADSYPFTCNVTVSLRHNHRFSNSKCIVCGRNEYDYTILSDGTAEIINYLGSASSLTIPSTIDGYKVTNIGDYAFEDCSTVTKVIIPNSVTIIGVRAFFNCKKLTSITVDSNNKNYSSVNGVLYNKEKTGILAYPSAKTDSSYTAPNTVTSIDFGAFYDCNSLKSVFLPISVKSIGRGSFNLCKNLSNITIYNKNCNIEKNDYYVDTIPKTTVINGYKNSTAEAYAKENGNKFVALSEECKHTYDSGKVTKAATCTAAGVKTYTCTKCKATKTETIKATGHKAVTDKAVAATCTKAGKTAGSHCSVCNTVITAQKTVKATGHSYDTGKITKQPTATTAGVKTYTCTKCKATKTETIPVLGLKAPTLKATVNANGTFKLSWNKISGADKYELYIKQANGSYKLMKTTTATSFTTAFATYGKQFSYKMRAVKGNTKSAYSKVVNAKNTKKLQTPAMKVTVNANGTFKLSWNKVTGADKYELYIKQANGSYKLMKTTTATSFTTAFATYGKQFSYKMRAVNSKNKSITSAYSSVVNAKNTKKLQTPSLKVAVNKNGSFKLSWGKVTGATSYQIYMKQSNGTYKLIKTTTSTSFTTAVASKGKTYSYKVRAVTSKNKNATSNHSKVVSAKRK